MIVLDTTVCSVGADHPLRQPCRDLVDAIADRRIEATTPLLTVSHEDLAAGLSLYERVERLVAFDSVLAAVSTRHGASALVSADRAFSAAPGVRHVIPDAAGVAGLLG